MFENAVDLAFFHVWSGTSPGCYLQKGVAE